jgi:hypothetical protein
LFFQQRRFVIVGRSVGWRRIVFSRRSGLCSKRSILSRRILRSYNNRQNEKAAGAYEQAAQVRSLQPSVLRETRHPAHHKVPPVAEPARPAGSLIRIAEELNLPPAYSHATPTSIPRRFTSLHSLHSLPHGSTGGCPNHVRILWPIERKQVSRSSACDRDSRFSPARDKTGSRPDPAQPKVPSVIGALFSFRQTALVRQFRDQPESVKHRRFEDALRKLRNHPSPLRRSRVLRLPKTARREPG